MWNGMIKVLIVDGHPTMCLGLKGLLLNTDISVAGQTGDGDVALRLAEQLRPDVVVTGLNLAGEMDGIRLCREIKELRDPPRVLVHTAYNLTDDVASCLLAGADSYLHKRCGCDQLLDAIRRTARGERVWDTGGRVGDPRTHLNATRDGIKLTDREREIVALIVRHFSNEQIACKLHLSLATVRTHIRHAFQKLNVERRRQLFTKPKDL